ncbi:glycosyltransferase family protein [bacterium]|nr:glycosyltransferase family protein [bacterium]
MLNTKLKVIAVIQARMGSTRLPKKALKFFLNKTSIEWIKYRLSFCQEIDQIVLSTANNKENDLLVEHAEEINLKYYRGSEDDLVSRLYETTREFKADAMVRITGDCPLVDPNIVDKIVNIYRKNIDLDYISNVVPPTFPDGMDVELISFKTLKKMNEEIVNSMYREFVTTTLMENSEKKYKIHNIFNKENLSHLRLTVDYPEDFELIKKIFSKLHKEGNIFYLKDILNLFKKEPKLIKINQNRVDQTILNNIRSTEFHNLKNNK